jgi:secondary thiamine-phosphate synthase enzyme
MVKKDLSVKSHQHHELIDLTSEINDLIKKEGISSGFCIIFVPHTTAAVTINEGADPDVKHDILTMLSTLIPRDSGYHHGEGNSDAHIKTSLLGSSEYIGIENNRLKLGTWQHVFFFEGDGPRTRRVNIYLFKDE